MKTVYVSLVAMVLLMGVVVLVSASQIDGDYEIEKGWNLIPGFIGTDQLFGDDILPENIKAVYILKQPSQEFVRVYPDPEEDKLAGLNDDYYEKTPQFVYSDTSGNMEYFFEESLPIEEFQLYRGWNFVTLSKYLLEGEGTGLSDPTLEDVSGDCNIQRAYLFGNGKWVEFNSIYPEMDSTLLNKAIVLKVSNDCNLGTSGNNAGPPSLPGGNDNYVEFGSININLGNSIVQESKVYDGLGSVLIVKGDPYNFIDRTINLYDDSWNKEFLTAPAWANNYMITEKDDLNYKIALWPSNDFTILIETTVGFIDGSDSEQVLEDYIGIYPSTISDLSEVIGGVIVS